MDKLTFTIELVKALAWPVVALVVTFTFKEKLRKLFEEMTELKGLGVEAKFARAAKEALKEAKAIDGGATATSQARDHVPTPNETESTEEVDPMARSIAPAEPGWSDRPISSTVILSNPKNAVRQARENIVSAAFELQKIAGYKATEGTTAKGIFRHLLQDGWISNQVCDTADMLLSLGLDVDIPDFEPTPASAIDYVQAAMTLSGALRNVAETMIARNYGSGIR